MRILPALPLCLIAPWATAQFSTFSITSNCSNNVFFNLTGVPTSTSSATGSGVLRATSTGDHLYQNWWYYRVAGDSREYAFHTGSGSGYVQLPAPPRNHRRVLLWTNVDGRGFSGSLTYEVFSTGGNRGVLTETMRVDNQGSTPLTLNLFHYLDLDLCGTTSNGAQFAAGGPRQLRVTAGSCGTSAFYLGCNADNYEVAAFSGLRGRLLDASVNDLQNSGVPFGPGDWTGAWQWQDRVIPPSGSLAVTVSIGIDFQLWTCGTATQARYCSAKPGTHGTPTWGDDRAFFGGALELTVNNGLPNAVPVVMLGVGQTCAPVPPFGTLAVNQIFAFPLAAFDAGRVARGCLTIPDDPSMLGFSFVNQTWFADPGAAGFPVAHTDGLELKLGSH
jgi:hypothetical protein